MGDEKEIERFVEVCVKGLVNHPDEARVERLSFSGKSLCLMVHLNPDDISLVIGRGGNNIRNIRELSWAIASKNKIKVTLVIKE